MLTRAYPAVLLIIVSCNPSLDPAPTSATVKGVSGTSTTALDQRTNGRFGLSRKLRRAPATGRTHYVVLQAPCAVSRMRRDRAAGLTSHTDAYVRHLARVQTRLAPDVVAAGARIVGGLTRLANALLVVADPAAVARLRRLPGVRRVEPAPRYRPHLTQSVPVVGGPALWQAVPDVLGRTIRVGVVDSGIDYTHAAFGGSGLVADYQANDASIIEPGTFPTARVVDGTDLVGDFYDSGDSSHDVPQPDPDPLDCPRPGSSGHGTHVASILGGGGVTLDGSAYTGPYNVSLDPAAFEVGPGVAPAVDLYAIKVFGCSGGSTSVVTLALEWASDPNGDGLFGDRLDVVNLSLGSKFGLGSTDTGVTENLVWLGTVVVASSGNTDSDVKRARPFFVTDAPGVVHPVISVANSWKTTAHYRSLEIAGATVGPFPVAEGRDNPTLESTGTVSGPVRRPVNRDGCDPFQNANQFAGAVALIDRGGCSFTSKFENAEAAGAVAAIVVDWSGHDVPWTMTNIQAALPGGMIRTPHGQAIHAALDGGAVLTATLNAATWWPATVGPDYIKDSSCRGPSAWDGLLKPDLAAPGTSILAAGSGTGWENLSKSGTSMSAPHVAGGVALLLEANGSLSPLEVKARLMSTAQITRDLAGKPFPVSLAGAGRMQVDAALDSPAYLVTLDAGGTPSPLVSASWGAQVSASPFELTHTVRVVNTSAAPATYTVSTEPFRALSGTTVTATPATLTVDAGSTADLEIRLAVDPALLPFPNTDGVTPPTGYQDVGRHFLVECDGLLRLTPTSPSTAPPLSLPFHALVRAAGQRQAGAVTGCTPGDTSTTADVALTQAATVDASEVTSAFVHLDGAAVDPLLALGVTHNLDEARSDPDVEPTLFFGVATAVDWLLPARNMRSAVGLHIDVDDDGEPDFRVAMDSETESGDNDYGNADIFTVRVYAYDAWAGDEYTPLRVNVVDPRSLNVPVHLNSAWVLPVRLEDLGLSSAPSSMAVRAYARQPDEEIVIGELVSFAPADLPFTPTVEGWPAPGFGHTPLHAGNRVRVDRRPDTTGDLAPDLLLLHHTNALGNRVEVISLAAADNAYEQGDVGVVTTAATDLTRTGHTGTATFVVTNHGPGDLAAVSLDITVAPTGVAVGDATVVPTAGSCSEMDGAGTIHCDLGGLADGAEAMVQVTVAGTLTGTTAGTVNLNGTVSTGLGCDAPADNDTASTRITVQPDPDPPEEESPPKKGCGCQAHGTGGFPILWLLALWWLARIGRNRTRRGVVVSREVKEHARPAS